ncbi:MAG: hypothetical protein PHY09_16815 [Desulfuromonadaceae bacterium]|nr:hypothetical protein [Desulfuromonadaceae bacterium]MDD5107578.1 hypothetical protein [Desulfuromonadaceae bacterium]
MRPLPIILTIISALLFCYAIGCFATEDVAPPVLTGFSLSPGTINTSTGAQTITATLIITDDLTGFNNGSIWLYAPMSSQYVNTHFTGVHRTSGTAQNGTYQVSLPWPQYSRIGAWKLASIALYDAIGNAQNYGRNIDNTPNAAFGNYSTVNTY